MVLGSVAAQVGHARKHAQTHAYQSGIGLRRASLLSLKTVVHNGTNLHPEFLSILTTGLAGTSTSALCC